MPARLMPLSPRDYVLQRLLERPRTDAEEVIASLYIRSETQRLSETWSAAERADRMGRQVSAARLERLATSLREAATARPAPREPKVLGIRPNAVTPETVVDRALAGLAAGLPLPKCWQRAKSALRTAALDIMLHDNLICEDQQGYHLTCWGRKRLMDARKSSQELR